MSKAMVNASIPPTQEKIKSILFYDKELGVFTWRIKPRSAMFAGDVAGKTNHNGYQMIGFGYRQYQAHRLAWIYEYGEWPRGQIDHINGIKTDNRISNLRVVDTRGNSINRKVHRSGKLPGAHFDKRHNRWQALISINGKNTHIGMFATDKEAARAYSQALANLSKHTEGAIK